MNPNRSEQNHPPAADQHGVIVRSLDCPTVSISIQFQQYVLTYLYLYSCCTPIVVCTVLCIFCSSSRNWNNCNLACSVSSHRQSFIWTTKKRPEAGTSTREGRRSVPCHTPVPLGALLRSPPCHSASSSPCLFGH